MRIIADLHIHSKYSRATSPKLEFPNLEYWAKRKGITLLVTGDFTHPAWFKEIKNKLKPNQKGLFTLKEDYRLDKTKNLPGENPHFILGVEISSIYKKAGAVRKIHNNIYTSSVEKAAEINKRLSEIGNLKSDGRPILGLDSRDLLEIILEVSEDNFLIPAHCLLPDSYILSESEIKKIKKISKGDKVFTHNGRLRKVKDTYKRSYDGEVLKITPAYTDIGLTTTPEHPFYAIKTEKYCPTQGSKIICKPNCQSKKKEECPHKYYENYNKNWIQAKNLEEGDILAFPRLNKTKDKNYLNLRKQINATATLRLSDNKITPKGTNSTPIPNEIKIDKKLCRLIGYYLAEGYTNSRDAIGFCLHEKETKYIQEIKKSMQDIFGLSPNTPFRSEDSKALEITYYSKILKDVFQNLFYSSNHTTKAHTKSLPQWILTLPKEKQVEILKGWWRGDKGYTTSRELMNQMKIIFLRLGIIPSISTREKATFNEKTHIFKKEKREIKSNYSCFNFYNLSFLKDQYNLLNTKSFEKFETKLNRRKGWMDKNYFYTPIRKIKTSNYNGKVYNLEVEDDNSYLSESATIHNCWTPWFSLFGSKSGFDSVEACFEDLTDEIFAVETGLSSDPPMNWRLSMLDDMTLISNSDAHSPFKLGRELNVLDTELSYEKIKKAIQRGKKDTFKKTIEFFPQEGRYHYDGHRKCNVRFSPDETKNHKGRCPECGGQVTVGVQNRVEELADRPKGEKPESAIPFRHLIPLAEIIGEALDVGPKTKTVAGEYQNLIQNLGSEISILTEVPIKKIKKYTKPIVAEGIKRTREENVHIKPGYDGEYGQIKIFTDKEREEAQAQQKLL